MQFHKAFSVPYNDGIPAMLDNQRTQKRISWMREEVDEFEEATTLNDQADAMIDLIYFALGTLVEMGVPPQDLFNIVHDANMAKLFPDGKPHYNAQMKVIKPATWADPFDKMQAWLEDYHARQAAPAKKPLELDALDGTFSLCRLDKLPPALLDEPFIFCAKTDKETSALCPAALAPKDALECEADWRGFRVEGTLEFSLVGIIATITDILAAAHIPVFVVSTFQTDYVFTKADLFQKALLELSGAGYIVRGA